MLVRVSSIRSYRDEFGTCKWHYLVRYFLGPRVAKLDKRLAFFSNTVALLVAPSNFYCTCLVVLTSLHAKHGSLPDDFSCKNIYNLLLELPTVSPRLLFCYSLVGPGKAFNRVDWSFLHATLARMGFGPSFISWVNLFYASPQSAVKFNGHMTPFFDLSRGVRQGVPLSPLSYVLYAEVLACAIRANPPISGLTLPGCSTPLQVISQYADDTSLVVTSDQSIVEVFRSYAVFERGSGSKLNLGESKGLWLGSWNGPTDAPLHLSWTFDKLKVLGGVIGPGNVEEDNWRPRIVAVENVLQSWKAQTLSYQGRALFVKALALSHIWYMASIFGVPAWVVRELNILVIGFFWKGNRELVARRVVVQASCFGGFSVASVQFKVWALLVQWIRRFVAGSPCWARFFEYHTRVCFGSSLLDVLSRPSMFDPGGLPPFYRNLLLAWKAVDGGFSVVRACLTIGLSTGLVVTPVSHISTRSVYSFLLSVHLCDPHCVTNFACDFGTLYWSATWDQLFWFVTDRPVIDLNWKIAHGVLYTAEQLRTVLVALLWNLSVTFFTVRWLSRCFRGCHL